MSVNKVILVGNVGKNPEMRFVGDRPFVRFTLATSEPAYTDTRGEQVPEITEWHNIIMWDDFARTAERYITKGTKLYIEGKLRTRTWQDSNAIKRNITEIIVERFDILSRAMPQQPSV